MQIGITGCGFTADHYLYCLKWHPDLKVVGATDRDPERASKFCNLHSLNCIPRSRICWPMAASRWF
jgi:predicted dehydrogenase